MQELIKDSWDIVPKKRPTFDRISLILRAEYEELAIAHQDGGISRPQHLMRASVRSFRANRKKWHLVWTVLPRESARTVEREGISVASGG